MNPPSHYRGAIVLTIVSLFITSFLPKASAQESIIGGNDATPGDYPWMVALVDKGRSPASGQICGGSLIGERWVLTAAHCVTNGQGQTVGPGKYDCWINLHDLTDTTNGIQRSISKIVVHPNFREDQFGTLYNDVALLFLDTPVNTITPIDIAVDGTHTADDALVRVIGWGATRRNGSGFPDILKEADVNIFNFGRANRAYFGDLVRGPHLPAGKGDGSKDSCQGDSGGPLFATNGGNPVLVGVVSFGNGCAQRGEPGIYARVSTYGTSWIQPHLDLTFGDPELNVLGRGIEIPNADSSPSRADNTLFGVTRQGRSSNKSYHLANLSGGALIVNAVAARGRSFSVKRKPPVFTAAGGSSAFTIQFNPRSRRKSVRTRIIVATNDPTTPVRTFIVRGRVRRR